MLTAYVGLGSNLDDPALQIRSALKAIAAIPGVHLQQTSRFYRSPPMGPADQPDYCNAVCVLDIRIDPAELLLALLAIERDAGRVRSEHKWGPRRIDLDLLHVEGVERQQPGLSLPHPGIASRSFVLAPLAELRPQLVVPGVGSIMAALAAVDRTGLGFWFGEAAATRSESER
jgi:2-amino-4-hydroxy-6-hydroxymethyldihydropteridine diphosphokinase